MQDDLKQNQSKYKWVITHFHILSKAWDAKFNLCDPVLDVDGNVTYPNDYGSMLRTIFSQNGVNAVSYGHSHVYERYYEKGTHYIEAAYLSVTFADSDAKPHPSGLLPIVEDNSRRSFMIAERKKGGIFATGYYADKKPKAFDEYQIADDNGNTVIPNTIPQIKTGVVKMNYKSELHCHTADISKCANFALEEMIEAYIKLGYSTIVITDHFNKLTFEGKEHLSWEEKCEFFVSGYKRAKEIARGRINILLGMEYRNVYNENDYLVFGVTEEFLKKYNKSDEDNIMKLRPKEFYNIVHENGMLIYQAHPFRDNMTITDPNYIDGLETLNTHKWHESRNDIASLWAKKYNLLECGGSDCHHKDHEGRGGIVTDNEIKTNADLLKALKGNFQIINPGDTEKIM